MADLFDVADIIDKMTDGFEDAVMTCLGEHADTATVAVREQLYSGIGGDGNYLSPTYDSDPYFEEPGPWQHRSKGYIKWKAEITPPVPSRMLGLAPRPENVPNLFINGRFHSEIFSSMQGDVLRVDVGSGANSADIVSKYGEGILRLSPTAIGYFANEILTPCIWQFFEDCGY